MTTKPQTLDEILYEYRDDYDRWQANPRGSGTNGIKLQAKAKQAILRWVDEVISLDTGEDVAEAIQKVYSDGYSDGYNDKSYESPFDSVKRRGGAVAPAVAKVGGRWEKQYRALKAEGYKDE